MSNMGASAMVPQPYHQAPAPLPPNTYGAYYGPQSMPMQPPMQVRTTPPATAAPRIPLTRSGDNGQYRFTLEVAQQPQRARMCGFGDKDRRPITPPPCIRLLIHDLETGKEVDGDQIDGSFFVLQVDLWNENADREVNVVRASSSTPSASISTATTTSYPPVPERQTIMTYQPHPGYPLNPQYTALPVNQQHTMFTRNLIGSLTVSAARLTDDKNSTAWWFVLQDLSVRTEGKFRLRMNFIDVGALSGGLQRGRAPVLAHVFSDEFQVFSAKKFPGVIESTALSKCFAHQGIKIPIRKDASKEGKEDDEEDY
ncbi:hypothetical protein LTR62_005566 [Meristemomyces frigidus]|uniref:Velvet domain-containing protein n=1 Tax=Meristemomyces frigidus TaxID=1508187 RepID=A0AAN7YNG7_9PEZI|nr:hypothetical protein LTR62_005566 [Meristemomyces frigidus]